MKTYFVSRHAGAIAWVKARSEWSIDEFIEHLDPAVVQAGDVVIGTLPVHLAAEVCARGARFYFLQLPQEAAQRGSEYTAAQMEAMGCSVAQFDVRRIKDADDA